MLISYTHDQDSVILRVKILDSSVSTGAGQTGLDETSSGLIISTIADNEATPTAYTQAAGDIETISTLGTYAAPSAGKCRFAEVDATNHKGIYEIQLADARYAVSAATYLMVSISGATDAAETDVVIPLLGIDPYDSVRGGMTSLPNAAAEAVGGLYTRGTGAGQIAQDANGRSSALVVAYDTGLAPLQPTTTGRKLDVSADGNAGIDWANVSSPTSTVGLTGTTIASSFVAADRTKLDALHDTRITATRAGYLDNLAVGGLVSSSAEVLALQNNTRIHVVLAGNLVRPTSGSDDYVVHLYLYDEAGNMEAPDSTPTLAVTNAAGTDRSANLSSVTNVSTGHYTADYTVADTHAKETLHFAWSVTEGGNAREYAAQSMVVDDIATDFTAADRAKLDTLHDTRITGARATNLDNLDQAISTTEANIRGADDDDLKNISDEIAALNNLAATDVWAAADSGHAAGTLGQVLADWADAGRLDVILDAVLDDTQTTIPGLIAGLNDVSTSDIETHVTVSLNSYDGPTKAELDAGLAALNDLSTGDVDARLAAIHLDHLFAATYDATNKPGASDALLNEMVQNNAGVTQYTAHALQLAPGGAGVTAQAVRDAMKLAPTVGDPATGSVDRHLDDLLTDSDVWGAQLTDHQTDGTFGALLQSTTLALVGASSGDNVGDLKVARDNIVAQIKAISAQYKPTYTIDGQTVQWSQYLDALRSQLTFIEQTIAAYDPYELASQGDS